MKNTTTPLSKKAFAASIDAEQSSKIIKHFNKIYECDELDEHEINIAYLAYLWKLGILDPKSEPNEKNEFLEDPQNDFDIMDYELQFEVPPMERGGINLDFTFAFYRLEELMELV